MHAVWQWPFWTPLPLAENVKYQQWSPSNPQVHLNPSWLWIQNRLDNVEYQHWCHCGRDCELLCSGSSQFSIAGWVYVCVCVCAVHACPTRDWRVYNSYIYACPIALGRLHISCITAWCHSITQASRLKEMPSTHGNTSFMTIQQEDINIIHYNISIYI